MALRTRVTYTAFRLPEQSFPGFRRCLGFLSRILRQISRIPGSNCEKRRVWEFGMEPGGRPLYVTDPVPSCTHLSLSLSHHARAVCIVSHVSDQSSLTISTNLSLFMTNHALIVTALSLSLSISLAKLHALCARTLSIHRLANHITAC